MHRSSRFAIGFALVVGATSCGDAVSGPATVTSDMMGVTSVTVSPPSLTIFAGATFTFTASVDAPSSIHERDVTWSSSDTTIATIDADGLLRARSAGTVTIIAASMADPTVKGAATVVSVGDQPGKDLILRRVTRRAVAVFGW